MNNRQIKILILITKAEIGGAQNFVFNLAKGLKKAGFLVTIGCGQAGYLTKKAANNKINFVIFKNLRRSHNPLKIWFFIKEIKHYLSKNQINTLLLNSSNTLPAGWGAQQTDKKIKTIFVFHGLSLLDENYQAAGILKFFYQIYFKFFLSFINQNVFVSQKNYQTAQTNNIAKRGTVIYNGLETNKIAKHVWPPKPALNFLEHKAGQSLNNKFILGSIGRLAYPKNYEFLITNFVALKKIKPNACLLIVGAGPNKKKYQQLIKKTNNQDNIFLIGNLQSAWRYLNAFDLFVLPSEFEGLSLTLIEAISVGLPVLATAVGGNPEILNYDSNQLYQSQDINDFLLKFKPLVNNEKLRQKIKERNLAQAKIFNIKQMVNKYINLIEKLEND